MGNASSNEDNGSNGGDAASRRNFQLAQDIFNKKHGHASDDEETASGGEDSDDSEEETIDLTPGKLVTRASLRSSQASGGGSGGEKRSSTTTSAKRPTKAAGRNSNIPRAPVLPPPDDEETSLDHETTDDGFTEFAELLVSFHLGRYVKKFGYNGVKNVDALLKCNQSFLEVKIGMLPADIRKLSAALKSTMSSPSQSAKFHADEQKHVDERVSTGVAARMKEEEHTLELISECDQGKTKKFGGSDYSACDNYRHSWGFTPGVGCMEWISQNKKQCLAGFTTALTVIPTALAFSFLGGMNSTEGLMGTWIIMLVLAIGGGCPGMVYCNAGAVAVVLVDLAEKEGPEYVFYAFMLSGMVTAVLGYVKVAKLLRLLPASVMVGFVNGLAIVIFFAQLKNFQISHDDDAADDDHRRLNSFSVLEHNPEWISGKELIYMLLNISVTMVAMFAVPYTCKQIPGALAGMAMSLIVEWGIVRPLFNSKTNTVGDVAKVSPSIPMPVWMNNDYDMPPLNMETFNLILPTALTISAVGLVESLMTVRFVTARTKVTANSDIEAIMLGVGNIVAGAFGGQGGCSEIGLTLINLNSGGSNRTSSFSAALFTLLIMYVAADGINCVPIAGLVGIMFVVVLHCFDFGSLKTVSASLLPKSWRERLQLGHRHKINRVDAVVIVAVTVITPFFDLAIAVAVGVLIAMLGFTWETADRLTVEVKTFPNKKKSKRNDKKIYVVTGQIYYASIEKFIACFDVENDPKVVELELHAGDLCDYSAIQAVNGLGDEYKKLGKVLRLKKLRMKSAKILHKGQGLLSAFGASSANDLRASLHGSDTAVARGGGTLHTEDFIDEDDVDVVEAGGQAHMSIEGYR